MNENNLWISMVVGFIPYSIRWLNNKHSCKELKVNALFWNLAIHWYPSGRWSWKLEVILISRLGNAIWSVLTQLRDGK